MSGDTERFVIDVGYDDPADIDVRDDQELDEREQNADRRREVYLDEHRGRRGRWGGLL